MLRLAPVLLVAALLAGCGSSKSATSTSAPTATTPGPTAAVPGGRALYVSPPWAVVVKGNTAVALHLRGGTWVPDRTGKVKVELIGPHAVDVPLPQIAATLAATTPLAESGLWIDGAEIQAKGGGLSETSGTIYGAPLASLKPGRHLAVAYARTATNGTAVAKAFRVR